MTATHTTNPAITPETQRGCQTATRRLRWEYTVTYRRHQRLHGAQTNNVDADETACEHLRRILPIVLAHHLPTIQLLDWLDPHPAIIHSTWQHGETIIEVFWDYRPDWTIGDPTALTIQPVPPISASRERVA